MQKNHYVKLLTMLRKIFANLAPEKEQKQNLMANCKK